MRFDPKAEIDATDWRLIEMLHENARLTFAELGRAVHLTAPAVTERVKRLEDRGILRGYRADVNLSALGRPLHVYFRIIVQPKDYSRFQKMVQSCEDFFECHHVTGTESFILRAAIADVMALEKLIKRLSAYGPTTTSLVLSSPVNKRSYLPNP